MTPPATPTQWPAQSPASVLATPSWGLLPTTYRREWFNEVEPYAVDGRQVIEQRQAGRGSPLFGGVAMLLLRNSTAVPRRKKASVQPGCNGHRRGFQLHQKDPIKARSVAQYLRGLM